jgi:hypothetical protein
MALRLQCAGYIIRLAAYTGQGFKEGVSLLFTMSLPDGRSTLMDVTNSFSIHWSVDLQGSVHALFRKFIGSSMPLHSKITIMAYVGTYYAIGSAWILTLANYLLIGWYNGHLDHYYIDSFKIYFNRACLQRAWKCCSRSSEIPD